MRITQLNLQGQGNWPAYSFPTIDPQLSVFFGPPRSGKSSLAQLASHLLFGKTFRSWRPYEETTLPNYEGSLTIQNQKQEFLLRRQFDRSPDDSSVTPRLTISASDGTPTNNETLRGLFHGFDENQVQHVFSVDFFGGANLHSLLENPSLQELVQPHPQNHAPSQLQAKCRHNRRETRSHNGVDRLRLEELVHQRDSIAQELEHHVGVRRRESGVLENELQELESDLAQKRAIVEQLEDELHAKEKRISEVEIRLRYSQPAFHSKHLNLGQQNAQSDEEIQVLDHQIANCRETLDKFQARESVVRSDLAKISPDGTADQVTCLTDGRASLGILESLLDELDVEVSQLARSHDPGRCLGLNSHARLSPVAKMLRHQVYVLCDHLTEQERHNRRHQLQAELKQLGELQRKLAEQLQLLHSQRESIILNLKQGGRAVSTDPQAPVSDHCRCESHRRFQNDIESLFLASDDDDYQLGDARAYLLQLQDERSGLMDEITALQTNIAALEEKWQELQNQRARLMGRNVMEEKQSELERLENLIQELLRGEHTHFAPKSVRTWLASDVLAQLTDGQLVQVRIALHNRSTEVIDSNGRKIALDDLTSTQHDQLHLALILALVDCYAQRGLYLPLILDEPFLRQDRTTAAVMAGVLVEFAKAGHQVLVFTEDRNAERTFHSLATNIHHLEKLRHTDPHNFPLETQPTVRIEPQQQVSDSIKKTRVVRHSKAGQPENLLRISEVEPEGSDNIYFLHENSKWDEFPILGNETATLFRLVDVHSISDLLESDPLDMASRLSQPDIHPETVQLWQSHISLMCFVPELTLQDAQVLTAVGIYTLEELADADSNNLAASIADFLNSERGRAFSSSASRYGRSQLGRWREGARRNRKRWQATRKTRSTSRPNHRRGTAENSSTHRKNSSGSRAESKRIRTFTLVHRDDVEKAPSIGPKTADRLAKVGIRTVADLLNADAEFTAEEVNVSHITAKIIASWQHQARLVCQIPDLPGYGAQLLVANGFTEPEQIAEAASEELVKKILAFCQTKRGQRILRSSEVPDAERIALWLESASHSRPVEAA